MAKPKNRRVGVQSSDIVVGSEVHARGAQQTGPSKAAKNAAALAGFLGTTGADLAGQHTTNQAEAGALAAQQGEVDIETLRKQEKSAAWVRGAEQIIGRGRAIEDEQALKEWYTTEFDKDKDLPTLRGEMNAWMKDRYDGLDAGIAKEVAPYLARGADALMKAHGASETAEGFEMVQNSMAISTQEWLSRDADTRTLEEWASIRQEYVDMYPNRNDGLRALASDMVNSAIASKTEIDLAENPQFEKMRTNPQTRDIMSEGIKEAKRIRVKDYMENTKVQRALVEVEAEQLIASGDFESALEFITKHSVEQDGQPANFTEGEVDTLIGKMFSVSSKEVLTPLMVEQFNQGNVFGIPQKFRDPAFDAWYAQAQDRYSPEEVGARTVQRVVRGGWMPTQLKDMMQMAGPGNPELLEQAAGLYRQFEAEFPGALADKSLINEKALMQIEAYDQLSADFGPERAVEMMRGEHDPSLYNQWTPEEKRTAQTDALSEVSDIDWSWTELQQNPLLKRLVDKRMRYFAGFGFTPEKTATLAIKDIDSKHQILNGQQFDNAAPWGPEGNDVIEYVLSKPEYEDQEIIPVPGEPNYAIIRDEGSMFDGGQRVRIRDMVGEYSDHKESVQNQAAAESNARVQESHKQEAIDRLFPGMGRSVFAEPGQAQLDLRDRRQAAWDSLSEIEIAAVFKQIADEEEADKLSRIETNKRQMTRLANSGAF